MTLTIDDLLKDLPSMESNISDGLFGEDEAVVIISNGDELNFDMEMTISGKEEEYERICKIRWPRAVYEKYLVEERKNTKLSWKQFYEYMTRMQEKLTDVSQISQGYLFPTRKNPEQTKSNGKKRKINKGNEVICRVPMCIGTLYAFHLSGFTKSDIENEDLFLNFKSVNIRINDPWKKTRLKIHQHVNSHSAHDKLYVVTKSKMRALHMLPGNKMKLMFDKELNSLQDKIPVEYRDFQVLIQASSKLVAFTIDGTRLFVLEPESGELIKAINPSNEASKYTALSCDGSKIMCGRSDGQIEFHHLEQQEDGTKDVVYDGQYDYFREYVTHSGQTVRTKKYEEILCVLLRGNRCFVSSRSNMVALEFGHAKFGNLICASTDMAQTITSAVMCGDMLIRYDSKMCLYLSEFGSGRILFNTSIPPGLDATDDYVPDGTQWVTCVPGLMAAMMYDCTIMVAATPEK